MDFTESFIKRMSQAQKFCWAPFLFLHLLPLKKIKKLPLLLYPTLSFPIEHWPQVVLVDVLLHCCFVGHQGCVAGGFLCCRPCIRPLHSSFHHWWGWKTECFSIMLPVCLQIAMRRHTKDAFPLTEREQMTNFNISFPDVFPHISGGSWAQEIFQHKGESWSRNGSDLFCTQKHGFEYPTSSSNIEITSLSVFQQVPIFLFFLTFQVVWSTYIRLHFLYWYQL